MEVSHPYLSTVVYMPKTYFFYTWFFFFFFFSGLFRATPKAYGESQARGPIRAVAAGLCHSHSNTGFQLRLLQLTATLDP